jgi:urease accessory protein
MVIPIPMIRMKTRMPICAPISTAMKMDEALLKLSAWLSPAFPVGGFAYSHGLEAAIETNAVSNASTMQSWLAGILTHGAGRSDAILLVHAHRATGDAEALSQISALAYALAPSSERLMETTLQGAAFAETIDAGWHGDGAPAPYPVAVGRAAAEVGARPEDVAALYLHAFASSLISAAIRLIPLGQVDGQRILAALHPLIHQIAAQAVVTDLDDIGSSALAADIASMQHETQRMRLFRS